MVFGKLTIVGQRSEVIGLRIGNHGGRMLAAPVARLRVCAGSAAADEVDDFDLGAGAELGFRPKNILYYYAVQFDGDAIDGNGENGQKASNCSAIGHLAGVTVHNNFSHFCSGRGVVGQILVKP